MKPSRVQRSQRASTRPSNSRAITCVISISYDRDVPGEDDRALERKVWLKKGGYICIDHAEALVKLGCTREELAEALGMAVYMGGGPSLMYAARASEAFDQFAAQAAKTTA